MTMYVLAFRSGQQAFQSILSGIGSIYEHNLYMSNLFAYLDGTVAAEDEAKAPPSQLDGAARARRARRTDEQGIRLENVSFRYPGQAKDDKWVLRNVDLFIPRGQSVALVGQNGAGKTTLVKLVTRLYEPTEGRILLDGKDLRAWDRSELLARFGVVFQDFNQYQLKLRENVGVGSVEHLDEVPRIERAVEQGGARGARRGPRRRASRRRSAAGSRTASSSRAASGRRSRSRAASCARRPTSSCSTSRPRRSTPRPSTRSSSASRSSSKGKTTLIISHRFPTVRMADRILVLENGGIAEDGTHDELLAADKTYAHLYTMQAAGYA